MGTTLAKTRVIRFSPTTACDSVDLNNGPEGGCAAITNLIPDPSTRNVWAVKPDYVAIETFADLNTPVNVEVILVVGLYVYGIIATSLNAGRSQPFCYNISNVFSPTPVTVYNITSGNCPLSAGYLHTSPQPTMCQVGNKIYVTHPGFTAPPYIGWFDISDPVHPVWTSDGIAATGGILVFGAITGGSGYDGGATAVFGSVPLTGGTGSLAQATIFITAGVVTRVVITAYGTAYTVGDSLSASNANLGGSGTGFSVLVAATQTTGSLALTVVPQWCAQFYQRLWLGINPSSGLTSVIFTDILAGGATNANQALTFGDTIPTIGAAGLGLNNQLGGIVQSLMVFKGVSYIIQITGDASLSTLATNTLNVATGTTSPRGIVSTPTGLMFAAPDGLREINFAATISDPIGIGGHGLTLPFTYGVISNPNSIALGFNRGVVRVSIAWQPPWTAYTIQPAAVQAEYWYDCNLKVWSGPHEIYYSQYSNYLDGWIAFLQAAGGSGSPFVNTLFGLVSFPANGSSYLPFSNVELTTGTIGSTEMSEMEISETLIMTTAPNQVVHMTVKILDQDGNTIATQTFTFNPGTSPSTSALYPRRISWVKPVVLARFAVDIECSTVTHGLIGFKIGDIFLRVRELDYLPDLPG